jgi:S1-C subfamily serine protease
MQLTFESGPRAGQSVTVDAGRSVSIGRDPSADVFVDDARVSRPHARVWVDASGGARIEDLRSTNGTFVNGNRIDAATQLGSGDIVTVGNTRLRVEGTAPAGAMTVVADTQLAPPPPGRPTGQTAVLRQVKQANRTSALAIGAVVVLVGVIAAGALWYVTVGRQPSNGEVVAAMLPSVVRITAQSENSAGGGTGWVLDADRGLIVTNDHVISGGQRITVAGESLTPRTANIVASSPCDDIAIIHVDDNAGLRSARTGSQAALSLGDDVLALGYPVSGSTQDNLVFTDGTVSVPRTVYAGGRSIPELPNVVQHTARVNPGNSGGPLLNRGGDVVGMNTILIESLDQNYAVGIDRIKEVADGMAAGAGIGWTGMSLEHPSEADLAALGFPLMDGLLVTSVAPGTSADLSGFGSFDFLVTAIDGHPVSDMPSYCEAVAGKQNGQESVFTFAVVDPETLAVQTFEFALPYR